MGFLSSKAGEAPVIVEGRFKAPVGRVYRAWTDPEQIIKWFGLTAGGMQAAEIELKVGGQWRFVMSEADEGRSVLHGTYLRIEPEACLEFSWQHVYEHADGRREETSASKVTVTFREEGASTLLHLRHDGIMREEGRLGVGRGWEASFEQLSKLLEA